MCLLSITKSLKSLFVWGLIAVLSCVVDGYVEHTLSSSFTKFTTVNRFWICMEDANSDDRSMIQYAEFTYLFTFHCVQELQEN